jgi:ABC-type transporter Mla subunit MlaD
METRPPTIGQLLIAAGFAISCFALLIFLWLSFGGPVPLAAKSYRVIVPFTEATQLAVESDVRISGVTVGKVKQIELSDQGSAEATLELEERYAPIPQDTKAILRQKTLLGETYVELTPGSPGDPPVVSGDGVELAQTSEILPPSENAAIPEGGSLDEAQVSDAVQLDEIFRTFDPQTRAAFRTWMIDGALSLDGRGVDLNAALGNLEPFSEELRRTLTVLDGERQALEGLVRDGGVTFDALSESGQLASLVNNAATVFSTTAARDADLQAAIEALPTFLDETRTTLDRLERFADDTDPLVTQLRPAARELSPTLEQVEQLAPELRGFLSGLSPVADRADNLKALRKLLDDDLPPLLTRLDPFLDQLNPPLVAIRAYRREITAFLANTAAATNGFNLSSEAGGEATRYLRTVAPLNPEALAGFPSRLKSNRTIPYVQPGGFTELSQGLESFSTSQCSSGANATIDPADAGAFPEGFFDRLQEFAFAGELSSDDIPAARCDKQDRFESLGGSFTEFTDYLHIRADP